MDRKKRTMKIMLLSLLMMLLTAGMVFADDEIDYGIVPAGGDFEALTVGASKNVKTEEDQILTYTFTPASDGIFVFKSTGKDDTYCSIIANTGTSEEEVLFGDDNDGVNFAVAFAAKKDKTYYLQCGGCDKEAATFGISLENAVFQSIEFQPISEELPIKLYEGIDGDWEYDYDDDDEFYQYFEYELPEFATGDKIIVTLTSGEEVTLTYDDDEGAFAYKNSENTLAYVEILDSEGIPDQEETNWEIEKIYKFRCTFKIDGDLYQFLIPVTICNNPRTLNSIEFIPSTTGLRELIDRTDGELYADNYFEYEPRYALIKGDQLKLTWSVEESADPIVEVYTYDGYNFVMEKDGERFNIQPDVDICWEDVPMQSEETPWSASDDQDHAFKGWFFKKSFDIPVKLVANNVGSIKYVQKNELKYTVGESGYMEEDDDGDQYYEYREPEFQAGDKLSVTAGGATKEYTYTIANGSKEGVFISADGEALQERRIVIYSDQSAENEWRPGDHYFGISYCGAKDPQAFKVTISLSAKDQAEVDKVIQQINAIPSSVTLSDEAAVSAVRKAYDALSKDQKSVISAATLKKLTDAETTIAKLKGQQEQNDTAAAEAVAKMIRALPATSRLTLKDEAAIKAARSAYDALTKEQQAKVSNYATLTAAEAKISQLKVASANDAINKIPAVVTLKDDATVKAARAAYDALSKTEKTQITAASLKKLTDAEATIAKLNKEAADKVTKMITALPATITMENESAVAAARKAYDELTADQKKLISATTLAKLTAAETVISNLKQNEAAKSATVELIKVVNVQGGKAKLLWEETTGVNGYQVFCSTSKKFKKGLKKKTVKDPTKTKLTVKKLKKGKTYFFKIRPYTNIADSATGDTSKVYGKWSNVKKAKIKK